MRSVYGNTLTWNTRIIPRFLASTACGYTLFCKCNINIPNNINLWREALEFTHLHFVWTWGIAPSSCSRWMRTWYYYAQLVLIDAQCITTRCRCPVPLQFSMSRIQETPFGSSSLLKLHKCAFIITQIFPNKIIDKHKKYNTMYKRILIKQDTRICLLYLFN